MKAWLKAQHPECLVLLEVRVSLKEFPDSGHGNADERRPGMARLPPGLAYGLTDWS